MNSELSTEGRAEEHVRGTDFTLVAAGLLQLDRADLGGVWLSKSILTSLLDVVRLPKKKSILSEEENRDLERLRDVLT